MSHCIHCQRDCCREPRVLHTGEGKVLLGLDRNELEQLADVLAVVDIPHLRERVLRALRLVSDVVIDDEVHQ